MIQQGMRTDDVLTRYIRTKVVDKEIEIFEYT